MKIGQVDIPEQLLDAQRNGELVVFAGAGVSVAPPSNYPQLDELAATIARGTGLKPEQGEPLDRFLGRLIDSGVKVHEGLRDLLAAPGSRPSSLHRDLLRLFPSAGDVRVVTTNFDSHFSTAAREIFRKPVETYYAPALPLGYDFNGIVYLHGNVEKGLRRVVLTDGDFGRAYLTEGWARRFLQDLFSSFTVLFVGYSHNDPVMNYLARGLPPEVRGDAPGAPMRRYAFTPERNHGHWDFLGIEPIGYPLTRGKNPHSALAETVSTWTALAEMGEAEHERRLREIARKGPPGEEVSADYLHRALQDPRRLRLFARLAVTSEWIAWGDEQGMLDSLWGEGPVGEVGPEVARWFAEFAARHTGEALSLVSRHGGVLSPALWKALVVRLAARRKPRPNPADVARWVVLLLHPVQEKVPAALVDLLRSCNRAGDEVSALLLFDHLVRPHLLASAADGQSSLRRRRAVVALSGDETAIKQVWQELFRPRLGALAGRLAPILAARLQEAELLAQAVEGKREDEEAPAHRKEAAFLAAAREAERAALDQGPGTRGQD